MKLETLQLLSLGTQAKTFGANAQILTVKDGTGWTFDGETHVQAPLDFGDCTCMIKPLINALTILDQADVALNDNHILVSNKESKVKIPLIADASLSEPSSEDDYQDMHLDDLLAMRAVSPWCVNETHRPITNHIMLVNGHAYATDGKSCAKHAIQYRVADRVIHSSIINTMSRHEWERIMIGENRIQFRSDDGVTVSCKLSSEKPLSCEAVFSSWDESNLISVDCDIKQQIEKVGHFLTDPSGSFWIDGKKIMTSKNLEDSAYVANIAQDFGSSGFLMSNIKKAFAVADQIYLTQGAPSMFKSGNLEIISMGLRG